MNLVRLAIVIATVAASTPSWGQAVPAVVADQRVTDLKSSTVSLLRRQRAAVAEATARARASTVSVPASSLSTANASNVVDLAQAAIQTNLANAKAGAALNLVGLAGRLDFPGQAVLSVAALENGVTRATGTLSWQWSGPLFATATCAVETETKQIESAIEALRDEFVATCVALASLAPPAAGLSPGQFLLLDNARAQCGLESHQRSYESFGTSAMQLTLSIDKYEKTLADGAAAAFPTSLKAAALAPLKNFQQPFVDCLDDAAVLREIWNKPKTRLALSGRVDVFPWIRGFHPDPTEPETPQRNDSEVRLELSYEFSGVEMKAGIGGGSRRSGVNQRLVGYISPSASVALAVARLGREPLYEDGQLNLLDGALPPRLVVGLDASLQYAPEPPPTQVANVQKVSVTAFFDFRFTEKLSVRLGIPLEAKLAERKAGTPNGPAKIDRQWTVPAFVATVLAL